jgi:hypothetical protein
MLGVFAGPLIADALVSKKATGVGVNGVEGDGAAGVLEGFADFAGGDGGASFFKGCGGCGLRRGAWFFCGARAVVDVAGDEEERADLWARLGGGKWRSGERDAGCDQEEQAAAEAWGGHVFILPFAGRGFSAAVQRKDEE